MRSFVLICLCIVDFEVFGRVEVVDKRKRLVWWKFFFWYGF